MDKAFSLYDDTLSRSYIKKLIINGSLYLNNEKMFDPSYKLIKGNINYQMDLMRHPLS